MSVVEDIQIELSIVLGSANIPIRQVLHMGRGATVPLESGHDDPTVISVNGKPVARGRVLVNGDQMSIEITEVVTRGRD
jgi:flagellar motor switch protein FliN/FliY